MKKILMGTSAIVMAGTFADPAKAAVWDLDWGGYYETSIVYRAGDTSNAAGVPAGSNGLDSDEEGIDVVQDGEIIFTPSITLDNGLTFAVNVQLEANSQAESDIIDESHVSVRGSFGQVVIGSTDGAGAAMVSGAPDVTWIGVNSGSMAGLIDLPGQSGIYTQPGGGDANKIVYYTPRFSGFQLGVSYAHDNSEDKNSPNGAFENLFDLGANYINSFGAFDVALSGRYGRASQVNGSADPHAYGLGLTLGYAGFKLGGSYARIDNDAGNETDFYDLGVSYTTGPWGVSFTYAHTDNDQSNAIGDVDQFITGINYALGPGVTAGAYAGYGDADVRAGQDVDGFIIGTGFKLVF